MMLYETTLDKETERRLGEYYQQVVDPFCVLQKLSPLSTYDFRILDDSGTRQTGWLEVKKKTGFFSRYEIIPITKWNFAARSPFPCWYMVERETKAMLFSITRLIKDHAGWKQTITRRQDQPEGSRTIVLFPISFGKIIYFL